jgi:hypothetical protein
MQTKPRRKISRLSRTMWLLDLISDPDDKEAARRRASTFYRRYRHNPNFPDPVALPDGGLAYFEDEVLAFIEGCERTDDPKANVEPLPAHWLRSERRNPRGNSHEDDTDFPPQAA